MAWLYLFLVVFGSLVLPTTLTVDASGASAVAMEVQWYLFCGMFFWLLEVMKVNEKSERRKDRKGCFSLVLLCCWILGLVFWFCCHSHFSISVC